MNYQRKSNLIAQFVLVLLLAGGLPTLANKAVQSMRFDGKSGKLISTGRKMDFCALFESNRYKSKFRTVALLFSPPETGPGRGGSDDIFFSADCNNKDYFAKADFSNARGMADLEKIWKTRSKTEPTIIEVEFSGRSSVSLFPTFGEFGWLRASFEINRIENLKLIDSPMNFPDLKADSPIIKRGSILKNLNVDLILYFFNHRDPVAEISDLITPRSMIRIKHKYISSESLDEFRKTFKNEDACEVEFGTAEAEGKIWRVSGTVTVTDRSKRKIKMKYVNRFEPLPNGSWILISSSIS